MFDWLKRDHYISGLILGFAGCALIPAVLRGMNAAFEWMAGRALFLKPETIPLATLALMTIGFRWLIVTRKQSLTARGFFFSLFITSILYLINRKFQFVPLLNILL